jgi:hypothetical protein
MAFSVAIWSVSALFLYAGHCDLFLQFVIPLGWELLQSLQAWKISLHLFVV